MAVSQNSWPVDPPRSARAVPGTSIKLTVANGPAGDILLWVAGQFHKRVENIEGRVMDDWGYANRSVRGSTATSNHASATAIDLNAPQHPLAVKGSFSAAQVAAIHAILAETGGVVRWGGDYSGRVDEMHFEINASLSAVNAAWARISGGHVIPGSTSGDDLSFDDQISVSLNGKMVTEKAGVILMYADYYAGQAAASSAAAATSSAQAVAALARIEATLAAPKPPTATVGASPVDYALLAKAMCDEMDRRARDGNAQTGPVS